MNLTIEPASRRDMKEIKRLYLSAFPREERAPFFVIRRRAERKAAVMLAARDGGEFVGFCYIVTHKKLAYLLYFAVDKSKRGMGYGTAILERLIEIYRGSKLFLAREQLDENAENYTERVNRHRFYLHSGFADLPGHIKELNVVYDIMGIGGAVSAAEYDALITPWAGSFMKKRLDLRLFGEK